MLGKTSIVLVQCVGGPLDVGWAFLISVPSKWRGMVDVRKLVIALSSRGMETSLGAIAHPREVWTHCAANLRRNA